MVASRPSGVRLVLATLLVLLLALTGAGRGFAAVPVIDASADVTMPICHSGPGEAPSPVDPGHPVQHDCCDDCALLASAVLPTPPSLSRPAPIQHYASHAHALVWAPVIARLRDPRLSRGPRLRELSTPTGFIVCQQHARAAARRSRLRATQDLSMSLSIHAGRQAAEVRS